MPDSHSHTLSHQHDQAQIHVSEQQKTRKGELRKSTKN